MVTYRRSDVGLSLARRWRVHWRAAAWRLVVGRPVVIGVVVGAIRVAVMVRRSLARVGAARCVVGVALRVHSVRHDVVLTVTHITDVVKSRSAHLLKRSIRGDGRWMAQPREVHAGNSRRAVLLQVRAFAGADGGRERTLCVWTAALSVWCFDRFRHST